MPVLTIGQTEIPYRVRESAKASRKRIVVTPEGVEVVVPRGTPREGTQGIDAYLRRRRRWVFDSVREIEERRRKLLEQRYASGAKLQYRGRWLMLDVKAAPVEQVEIRCRNKFEVRVPEDLERIGRLDAVQIAFDGWLRGRTERDVRRFGRRHEASLGVEAASYKLTDSATRWGSCERDGVVRVHWRLVQAPRTALEYVVAHEVTHLVHRNHSPEFWQVLGGTMPGWREAKGLLERWEGERRAV